MTELDRRARPAPGPEPQIKLPRFTRFQLKNGLSVLVMRHDDMPEVSGRLLFLRGAANDRRDRAGTALMVARALTEGTKERSAREIAEWAGHLGVRFGVDVNHDSSMLSFHCLSHVLDGALEFLAEVTTRPAFAEDEVARLRDERLDEIAAGMDEPRVVASLRVREAVFGEDPYGMRVGGTDETVRSIEPGTLRDFHERFYRPSAATLILVGDLPDAATLERQLESVFGGWEGPSAPSLGLDDPVPADRRRIWAIPWPGPQTEIRVGGVGIARRDDGYAAAMLMNSILGGLFSSRINMNLREDKGWTYGARSRVQARARRGPLYVATAVDARVSVEAVQEILGEMDLMRSEAPGDEEMTLAVNSLTKSLPRLFETAEQVSGRIAHQVLHELPDDYWEGYADMIRSVRREDVQRVAQRIIDINRVAVVVVGPVADFRRELEGLGPAEIRDIYGRPAGG